jgi:uncharacterized protein (DUF1800 family)
MSVAAVLKAPSADIGPKAALHVLNRLGYGPRPGDVKRVLDLGVERYIQNQFDAAPDAELEVRLRAFPSINYSTAQILAIYNADNRSIGSILEDFYNAKIVRAVHSKNQLLEVMVDFWFNHFNVYIQDGFVRYSIQSYEREAIRPLVLGKFRALLGANAAHPAMLFYLDNYLSTASRVVNGRLVQGLNENYGRELLELHTVGVDAGYTQEHVFDAARCFTGWGIDNVGSSGNFIFRLANHDRDAKSVFGLNVPAGGGKEDGDRLLDYLAVHPATAQFVSKKLAQRFVADDPPARLVERMAETWLATGGDIREVMLRMIGSAEFWAPAFEGGSKAKTPLEYVVSSVRAAGGEVTSATRSITGNLANMGMPLYQCIPPTGYSVRGADWLNPSSHLYRMNFGLDLGRNAIAGVNVDVRGLASAGELTNPRALASSLNRDIFANTLSRETLDAASRVDTRTTSISAAARVLGLLLASPENQVR